MNNAYLPSDTYLPSDILPKSFEFHPALALGRVRHGLALKTS